MGFDIIEINLVYFKNDTLRFKSQGFPLQVISANFLVWLKTLILEIFVYRQKMRKVRPLYFLKLLKLKKNKVPLFFTILATRTMS